MFRRRFSFRRRYRRRSFRRGMRPFRRIRRTIRKVVRNMSEHKFFTSNNGFTQRLNKSALSFFDAIAQGTAYNNRIGNMVQGKRLSWFLQAQFIQGNAGAIDALLRISLVYPRKSIGGQTEVNPLITAQQFNARWDPRYFYTMYDKVFGMQAGQNASGGNPSIMLIKGSKAFWGKINYDANLADREPVLVIWSSLGNADPSYISVTVEARTSFIDI